MDCAEIRQCFVTGGAPSGPAVLEHAEACASCRELLGNGAALGRRLADVAPAMSRGETPQLVATESLIANDRGVRAYLRSRSTRVRWALLLALPLLLLGRELARERVPLSELGLLRWIVGLGLLVSLAIVTRSALRSLSFGQHAVRLRSLLAAVAWALPCALWLAPESHVGSEGFSSNGFALRSLACFGYGSALAAPSFVLLWAVDRGVRVTYRVWALAAGMVALVSSLILLLHCPSTNRAHLLAGHFSIGLVWFVSVSFAYWSRRAR